MWNETLDVVVVREVLGTTSRLLIVSPAVGHHIRQTRPVRGLLCVFEDIVAFDPTLSEEELKASAAQSNTSIDALSRTKIVQDASVKSKHITCWTCAGRSVTVRVSAECMLLLVDGMATFNFLEIELRQPVVNAIRLVASNPTDPDRAFTPERVGAVLFPEGSVKLHSLARRHGAIPHEFVVADLHGALISNKRIFVGIGAYTLAELPFVSVEPDGTIVVTLDSVQKLYLHTSKFRQGLLLRMWLHAVMARAAARDPRATAGHTSIGSLPKSHALLCMHRQFCGVSHSNGSISRPQLQELMAPLYPSSRISESMFRFFDSDNSGEISFEEFAVGMLGLLSPSGTNLVDRYRFTFSLFDENGDGSLSEKEVVQAIQLMQRTGLSGGGGSSATVAVNQQHFDRIVHDIFKRLTRENKDEITVDDFMIGLEDDAVVRMLSLLGIDAGSLVRLPAARLSAELLTPMESEWARVAAIMHAVSALILFFRISPESRDPSIKEAFLATDFMIPRVLYDLPAAAPGAATTSSRSPTKKKLKKQTSSLKKSSSSERNKRVSSPAKSADGRLKSSNSSNVQRSSSSFPSSSPLSDTSSSRVNDDDDDDEDEDDGSFDIGLQVYSPAVFRIMQQFIVGELHQLEQSMGVDDISGNLMLGSHGVPKRVTDPTHPDRIRYDSQDGKYTVMSISRYEILSLANRAGDLVEHVSKFPNSYLPRFLCLFTVNGPSHIEPLHFFIKMNPQPTVTRFTLPPIAEMHVGMTGPTLGQPVMLDPGWQEVILGQLDADLEKLCMILPRCKVTLRTTVYGCGVPALSASSSASQSAAPLSSGPTTASTTTGGGGGGGGGGAGITNASFSSSAPALFDDGRGGAASSPDTVAAVGDEGIAGIPRPGPLDSRISVQVFNKVYVRDYTPAAVEVVDEGQCCGWFMHSNDAAATRKGRRRMTDNNNNVIAIGSLATKLRSSQKSLLPHKRALADAKANTFPLCFEIIFLVVDEEVEEEDDRASLGGGPKSYLDIKDKDNGPSAQDKLCLPYLRRGFVDFVRRSLGTRRVVHLPTPQLTQQCIADTVVTLNGTEGDLTIDRNLRLLYLAWNGRTLFYSSLRATVGFGMFRRKHPMTYGGRRELLLRGDLDIRDGSYKNETIVKFVSTTALERLCEEVVRTSDAVKSFVPTEGRGTSPVGVLRVASVVWNLGRRLPPESLAPLFAPALQARADVVFVYSTECYYFPKTTATELTCEEDWVRLVDSSLPGYRIVTSTSAANGRLILAASHAAFPRICDVETTISCVPDAASGLSMATCIAVSMQVDQSTVAAVCVDLPREKHDDDETHVGRAGEGRAVAANGLATPVAGNLQIPQQHRHQYHHHHQHHAESRKVDPTQRKRFKVLQALFQSLPAPHRAMTGASASSSTTAVEWGERASLDFIDRHDQLLLLGDFRCPILGNKLDIISSITRGQIPEVLGADTLNMEISRGGDSVLAGFSEAPILFPPTGPYLCGSVSNGRRIYDEDDALEPRWTSRIMWKHATHSPLDNITPLMYSTTSDILTSQYDPVISLLDLSTRRQWVDPMRRNLASVKSVSITKLIITNLRIVQPIRPLLNEFLPGTRKVIPPRFSGALVFQNRFFGPDVCASSVVEDSSAPVWKDVLEAFVEGAEANLFALSTLTVALSHVDASNKYHRIACGQYPLEALLGSAAKLLRKQIMPLTNAGIRMGALMFDIQLQVA